MEKPNSSSSSYLERFRKAKKDAQEFKSCWEECLGECPACPPPSTLTCEHTVRQLPLELLVSGMENYVRKILDPQEGDAEINTANAPSWICSRAWNLLEKATPDVKRPMTDRRQRQAAAASRREFSLVLFWSLDRFSREGVFETLQYLRRLTAYGVGYRSFTEQYLDSCGMFRDAVISILAVIAKQERVRLSERTLAGLARARAQGRVGGRPRVQCDQSKVMKLHADGNGLGVIAKQLNLTKTTIYRIINANARKTERSHPPILA
jgi:hypothetical protein